ncbi:MAG: DUF2322 family protein [Comamonas sp.]
MLFAEQLQTLPSVDHLAQIQLIDEQGQTVATIDNVPGKSGSVRVYAALAAKHGALNVAAAQEGLILFAEHTTAAQDHPGSHPNIDRLFEVIDSGKSLRVALIHR